MSQVTWKRLKNGPNAAIVRDLIEIREQGYSKFDAKALAILPVLFGSPERPANTQEVKKRLMTFLMAQNPKGDPNGPLEKLNRETQLRLVLFRATGDTHNDLIYEARTKAGRIARVKPIKAVTVRSNGGIEYYVIKNLSEEIDDKYGGQADGVPRVFPTHGDYSSVTAEEFDRGFWWRQSTNGYIDRLAGLNPITIFAGADGAADVGPPLHKNLLSGVLRARLLEVGLLDAIPPDDRQAAADRLVDTLAASCPTPHLGSIVRELSAPQTDTTHQRGLEEVLFLAIQTEIAKTRSIDGFLAEAIIQLAFDARAAGRDVEIVSAHFDGDIAQQQEAVRETDEKRFAGLSLKDYEDGVPSKEPSDGSIALMRLHGRSGDQSRQGLIVGEVDFFSDDPVGKAHLKSHVSRAELVKHAVDGRDVIFVGTSLTDPGVISVLAACKHLPGRRYAVLLPPDITSAKLNPQDHPVEYSVALDLVARRYRHLGVTPIMVDFEQQVPQLLREVAARITHGSSYTSYAERANRWWDVWAPLFGYDGQGEYTVNKRVLWEWRKRLRSMRDKVEVADVRISVWIRNHHTRTLFRLATSKEPRELKHVSIPVHPGGAPSVLEQRVFREGRTIAEPLPDESGNYVIGTPLILNGPDWHHLPVGVVTVASETPSSDLERVGSDPHKLTVFSGKLVARLQPYLELPTVEN